MEYNTSVKRCNTFSRAPERPTFDQRGVRGGRAIEGRGPTYSD